MLNIAEAKHFSEFYSETFSKYDIIIAPAININGQTGYLILVNSAELAVTMLDAGWRMGLAMLFHSDESLEVIHQKLQQLFTQKLSAWHDARATVDRLASCNTVREAVDILDNLEF